MVISEQALVVHLSVPLEATNMLTVCYPCQIVYDEDRHDKCPLCAAELRIEQLEKEVKKYEEEREIAGL